jgi:glycosyltransferase involved in cell wall biosynthesis
LQRIPTSAPFVAPLPAATVRPLWSVMIPVYNCTKYLPETLQSVLSQDIGENEMQIAVVDDASTDADVEAIVKLIGKGRINYYRQPYNVGCLRNFETCIKHANGKLIHLLHGDDRVKEGFYKKIFTLFQQNPQAGAAFSNYSFINEEGRILKFNPPEADKEGILKNWLIRIAERQRIQYVAMAVRREVYEKLGSFYGVSFGEDWEMWVRIARYYPVTYTPEVLGEYRTHPGSLTWRNIMSGEFYKDLLYTLKQIQEHVPKKDRKKVMIKAKRHCAHYLVGMAKNVWVASRSWKYVQVLIKRALTFSTDSYLLLRILKLYYKIILSEMSKLMRFKKIK